MNNKFTNTQSTNLIETLYNKYKNRIGLPLIALGLDLFPVLIIFSSLFFDILTPFALLIIILSPIAGFAVGAISISKYKDTISKIGKIIAIIAIALPLLLVAIIIVFFIGVETGIISFM